MKYVKMLGLAAVAAAALMAFVGAGTASATTLTSPSGTGLGVGKTISATNEGVLQLTGGFKNIECNKGSVSGEITNAGSATTTVSGVIKALTFEECNCEVVVIQAETGGLEIHSIAGGHNGTLTGTGTKVTVNCSTIFGNVHCIYLTNADHLGTLTGSSTTGSNATMDITAEISRQNTNALCAEEAIWHAKYSVKVPGSSNENFLDVD